MKTVTDIESMEKLVKNQDWETIIKYTRIPAKPKVIERKELENVNMELVCVKLKNDLEWYCNLPEKNKTKTVLRSILDNSGEPSAGYIEKWWLLQ